MGPVRQLRPTRPTLRRTARAAFAFVLIAPLAACTAPASDPSPRQTPPLRIDQETRTVEFIAEVAIDTTNPDTPDVYLELVACSPDSREHESLVVTPVPPSQIHAALLVVGAEPGSPGRVAVTETGITRTPATGTPLAVEFAWTDPTGRARTAAPHEWIRSESGARVHAFDWVFAGSRTVTRQGRTNYDADGTGTVIGLTTFGSEVIAPTLTLSPDSATDTPALLANNDTVPPRGSAVTVRITRAD